MAGKSKIVGFDLDTTAEEVLNIANWTEKMVGGGEFLYENFGIYNPD